MLRVSLVGLPRRLTPGGAAGVDSTAVYQRLHWQAWYEARTPEERVFLCDAAVPPRDVPGSSGLSAPSSPPPGSPPPGSPPPITGSAAPDHWPAKRQLQVMTRRRQRLPLEVTRR